MTLQCSWCGETATFVTARERGWRMLRVEELTDGGCSGARYVCSSTCAIKLIPMLVEGTAS